MARGKNKLLLEKARKQTNSLYFGGLMPPRFLVADMEQNSSKNWNECWQAVLQATWEEVRSLLGETPHKQRTGYPTLKAMEASLKDHLEMIQEQAAKTDAFCLYHYHTLTEINNQGQEHGLDTPLGTAFAGIIELDSEETKRGWSKPVVMDVTGGRTVDEDEWEQLAQTADLFFQLPDRSRYEPANLSHEYYTFPAKTTFRKAMEMVRGRYLIYKGSRDGLNRTVKLLEFRRSVVLNVLWQFEMYGHVGPLTLEQVEQIEEVETPPGRPPQIDYEQLEGILPNFISRPEVYKHHTGQHKGQWYVSKIYREIDVHYSLFDEVSGRRARHAITVTLEKLCLE